MKHLLLTLAIVICSFVQSTGQDPVNQSKKMDTTNRIENAKQKYEELFRQVQSVSNSNDPELMSILQNFIFGEVFYTGNLNDTIRELITITTLATNQLLPQLTAHTNAALNIGVKPIEIREVIYQLAPFIGFPKVLNAMDTINSAFKSRGMKLPCNGWRKFFISNTLITK